MKEKIKNLEELQQIIADLKSKGKKIVHCHGVFDLLHIGHIRYLTAAAVEGDILFVAINSDRSVRVLKGETRPLFPVSDRAELVAAFECVDNVMIFDDLTADFLLDKLRPEIHAKGTDYTVETVPERKIVQSYGGRIAIVGDSKDRSSANFFERIQKRVGV